MKKLRFKKLKIHLKTTEHKMVWLKFPYFLYPALLLKREPLNNREKGVNGIYNENQVSNVWRNKIMVSHKLKTRMQKDKREWDENGVLKIWLEGAYCPPGGPETFVRPQGKDRDEASLGSCRNSTWKDKGWGWVGWVHQGDKETIWADKCKGLYLACGQWMLNIGLTRSSVAA